VKVLINESIPEQAWSRFVKINNHATPFQTYSYFRFFNSIDNFAAKTFAVIDRDEVKALAVVTTQGKKGPGGFITRRQVIYGGPLVDDGCPVALDLLLKSIDEHTSCGTIYSEIRNLSDYSSLNELFLQKGYTYVPYLNFRVDTSDLALMTRRVSSSRIRQIKKAHQQSVTCRNAQNVHEVKDFYLILNKLYKTKLHRPLPQQDFFVKFFEQDLGVYLLIWHNDEIIGGIMCPVLLGRALYEFYICGRDDVPANLYPGVMATWNAMTYACENGIPLFDFMGAGKPEDQYGVRDFKARFGGELVEYGRYLKVRKPLIYKTGKFVLNLQKRALL